MTHRRQLAAVGQGVLAGGNACWVFGGGDGMYHPSGPVLPTRGHSLYIPRRMPPLGQ